MTYNTKLESKNTKEMDYNNSLRGLGNEIQGSWPYALIYQMRFPGLTN